MPTASATAIAPRIYSSSSDVQPGDVITLEGVNFVTGSAVWLATDGMPTQLVIVSSSKTSELSAQLPSSVSGGLIVWITNANGTSNSVGLNAAGGSCTTKS